MNNPRVNEAGRQAAGSIKEAIGKVTGDAKIEAEGAAQKAASKKPVEGARDSARSPVNK